MRWAGVVQGRQRGELGGPAGVRAPGAPRVAQLAVSLPTCDVASFTEVDEQIAPARSALTARAGRWATIAVGRDARPVPDVAAELGCDWHTAYRAVLAWGEALLADDTKRVGAEEASGLD